MSAYAMLRSLGFTPHQAEAMTRTAGLWDEQCMADWAREQAAAIVEECRQQMDEDNRAALEMHERLRAKAVFRAKARRGGLTG